MLTFKEIGINEDLRKAVEEMGFEEPMPIQEKVIPHILNEENGDIVGLAQTGTGKTAAFGLPLIQNTNPNAKETQHLILCPTRELCIQISNDLIDYTKYLQKIKVVPVFGGASIEKQIKMIKKGAHIISATPGRLLDLMKRGVVKLGGLKTVVLDEADEMLNMGFREDLEKILQQTPDSKRTLLFSATMPKEVEKISRNYMNEPVKYSVGKQNSGAENIKHICYMVHEKDRYQALKRIVDFVPDIYGIVFCRTKKETRDVAAKLFSDGYDAEAIHGDLSQSQRDEVMDKFRKKHLKILVATDVAARGLDVDDINYILNYNLPDELEVYTHRSGRTGRAGKNGTSIVIINMKEKSKVQYIEKSINKKFSFQQVPTGEEICEKQVLHLIEKVENTEVDLPQIESFLPSIYKKLEWMDKEELIRKIVSLEFSRFLNYYKKMPDLSTPKSSQKSKSAKGDNKGMSRFFINLGKTDNLNPQKIIGMINDYTGKRNIEIGEIEILKNFSFFEADSAHQDLILKSFNNKKMNNRRIAVETADNKKKSGKSNSNRTNKNLKNQKSKKRKKRKVPYIN
jgi:ATP-dependent RNA helicase DeaD